MQLDLLGERRPPPLNRSRGGQPLGHPAACAHCTPPASTAPTRSPSPPDPSARASSCHQSVIFTPPCNFAHLHTSSILSRIDQGHAAALTAERHSPAGLLGLSITRQHQPPYIWPFEIRRQLDVRRHSDGHQQARARGSTTPSASSIAPLQLSVCHFSHELHFCFPSLFLELVASRVRARTCTMNCSLLSFVELH